RDLEAKAIYNLANTKYKLGNAQAKKDINGAIGLYRESLDYYRRAMEMNEKDRDAKYNHELVEKQLKVLLDRLKKQPPRKQSDKRKDQGEKDRKQASRDKQKHRKHGENKQSKQKKQQQPGTKKKQAGAEQGKRKATSGKKGKKAQLQTGKQEKKEMTPEEARMLLNAFGKQKSIGKLLQHKGGYFPQVVKDW
ncbi:MAG: hypothetical protein ACE5DO_02960, partial [Desulfobacterales bacterium]